MYGAYRAEKLVGVISLSRNHTISCIFVDGKYHRKGVGKKLYRKLLIEELCIHR